MNLMAPSLQWGHGESAVENQARRKPLPREATRLQWGHAESAVENKAEIGRIRRLPKGGFNGATANPPWKTAMFGGSSGSLWALQWGHGESAVENLGRVRICRPDGMASM